MSLIRRTVVQLRQLPEDPRNWRPNILLFSGDVSKREGLVRIASWLVHDRGILTVAKLAVGDVGNLAATVKVELDKLDSDLESMGVVAFAEVDIVPTYEKGAVTVAQSNGIAGIESNTVMFGWSDKVDRQAMQLRIVSDLALLGKSAVICLPRETEGKRRRTIHVWWGGLQENGDLLVLFAHLLSLTPDWRGADIVVNSVASNEMTLIRNGNLLRRLITTSRINARAEMIVMPPGAKVHSIIKERSAEADIVLLGLRGTNRGEEAKYAERITKMAEGLPTVLFVRNAGEFRGQLLGETEEAEEGVQMTEERIGDSEG